MHIRSLVPMGLVLVVSTGCQSYFPYGYGNAGAYPTGSVTYAPSSTGAAARNSQSSTLQQPGQFPTPAGQKDSAIGSNRGQPSKDQNAVPKYKDPSAAPKSLGTPDAELDEGDPLDSKRGSSSLQKPAKASDDSGDDLDNSFSSSDDENFVSPVAFRQAAGNADDRQSRRPAASPYKKDPKGYSWLRGVVARDPKTNSWRITYDVDPPPSDPYKGSLTLVKSDQLDMLLDNEVVVVEGEIDRTAPDKFGKPSYRARRVTPLQPKDE